MKILSSKDLAVIDERIRSGQQSQARLTLSKISPSDLKRSDFGRFANLLSRAGLFQKGLRLLNPFVRHSRLRDGASPEERLEYAYLLIKIGALNEARSILTQLNPAMHPDSLLYTTFALTPEWRYEETIPLLREYLTHIGAARPYQALIAKVNLAAALIFCRHDDEAAGLLSEAKTAAAGLNAGFLLGSLHELSAQLAIAQENFTAADAALNEASRLLQTAVTAEHLYVRKWRLVLEFLRSPRPAELAGELKSLRTFALAKREWEVARDLDFQLLKRLHEEETFAFLYCGSPTEVFRRRLEKSYPAFPLPADAYAWSGEPRALAAADAYDVQMGVDSRGREILERGQSPHRLWLLLCRDFYRPQSLAQISAWLYPDELYHPVHSPLKVHQIVSRLRRQLEKARVPIHIVGFGGTLRIEFRKSCALVKNWRLDSEQPNRTDLEAEPALTRFSGSQFQARDLALALDISLSSAIRRINRLVADGKLIREGIGKKTAYRVKSAA